MRDFTRRIGLDLEMLPYLSLHNKLYCSLANFKHASQLHARMLARYLSNHQNIFLGEFGFVVTLASRDNFRTQAEVVFIALHAAAFLSAVVSVLSACTKKQMNRVYAGWIIAGMANAFIKRVNRCVQKVSNAVRSKVTVFSFDSQTYKSIAVIVAASIPKPTIQRILNLNLLSESSDLLRRKMRKYTIRFSHLNLLRQVDLVRLAWCSNTQRAACILPRLTVAEVV